MEVIRLSGYTEDEKMNIGIKYLLPKQMKNTGLKEGELSISEAAVRDIVRYYTREAGVRAMERELSKICRKAVKQLLIEKKENLSTSCTASRSPSRIWTSFSACAATPSAWPRSRTSRSAKVTGLAWTEVGGELLTIEVMPGKGKTITGKLGEVMQESIRAALSVVSRARSRKLGVKEDFYQKNDIHIHLPEGATPKDGPSAGIGIATTVSVLSGILCLEVAMTGETALRGEALHRRAEGEGLRRTEAASRRC